MKARLSFAFALLLLLASCALLPAQSPTPAPSPTQPPTVACVSLGMTYAQALAAVKQYYGKQAYHIESFVDTRNNSPLAFVATVPNPDMHKAEIHNKVTVSVGYDGRVLFAELERGYSGDPQNRPTFENFSETVLGKYGGPTLTSLHTALSLDAYWFYDANGQKIPHENSPSRCTTMSGNQQGEILYKTPNVGRPGCPVSLRLQAFHDHETRQLVDVFYLTLFDEPALMRDIQSDKDALKRKRAAEVEAGRSVHPQF